MDVLDRALGCAHSCASARIVCIFHHVNDISIIGVVQTLFKAQELPDNSLTSSFIFIQ